MKRQLYNLYEQDYDSIEFHGVYEGPTGLDIGKLHKEFTDRLRPVKARYPKYNGQRVKYVPLRPAHGVCCSGAYDENWAIDGTIEDVTSQEYKDWLQKTQMVTRRVQEENEAATKTMKMLYPGKDETEMFLSYLKQEKGFKEVKSESFNI